MEDNTPPLIRKEKDVLDLKYKRLTLDKLKPIFDESNYLALKNIILTHNYVGDEGIAYLVKGLDGTQKLELIVLSYCDIGDKGLADLAKFLEANRSVKKMEIIKNTFASIGPLAKALASNKHLQSLDISDNNVGDDGAKMLVL